jgi:hypothetical protein
LAGSLIETLADGFRITISKLMQSMNRPKKDWDKLGPIGNFTEPPSDTLLLSTVLSDFKMSLINISRAFQIGLFRFTLTPQEVLFVPALNKANMLRGAFGYAFRRLCCVPECPKAHECPLFLPCPYREIFEPSPPPGVKRLSKNQDIPRSFAFRASFDDKTKFAPGEDFEFGLVLIGRALEHFPYFLMAFRELATQGLGLNRAKCILKAVCELVEEPLHVNRGLRGYDWAPNNLIYASQDQILHPHGRLNLERWVATRVAYLGTSAQSIKINFFTPTSLRGDGEVKQLPDFHCLFKRLRDRISALSTFFGSGPLDVDFAGLGRRSEQIRTAFCNVQWRQRFRTSSKTRQRHEMSGFVGEAVYEGDLEEFLPWLTLGELVHVGKHTAWGMGNFCLEPSAKPAQSSENSQPVNL